MNSMIHQQLHEMFLKECLIFRSLEIDKDKNYQRINIDEANFSI